MIRPSVVYTICVVLLSAPAGSHFAQVPDPIIPDDAREITVLSPEEVSETETVNDAAYEEPAVFPASRFLTEDALQGPHYNIGDSVYNDGLYNTFRVFSEYGTWDVAGEERLSILLTEIHATAILDEESKTERFVDALAESGKQKIDAAGRIIAHPVETIKKIPGGAKRLFEGIKSKVEKAEASETAPAPPSAGQIFGKEKARRIIAAQLGVNPYTHNAALDHELDEAAWVTASGGLTLNFGTSLVAPGVGMVMTGVNVADTLSRDQIELAEPDLNEKNAGRLAALGISPDTTAALLGNQYFDSWTVAAMIANLDKVGEVPGLDDFVFNAALAESHFDQYFFTRTAQLFALYHQKVSPITKIMMRKTLPYVEDTGESEVFLLWVDYVQWTENIAGAVEALAAERKDSPRPMPQLWFTGSVSEACVKGLTDAGFTYKQRIFAQADESGE